MAISSELMYAILAMDSYNRGYDPGITLTRTQVGNATIGVDSAVLNIDPNDPDRVDQAAGFYAVEYEWNGETIISFQGTDVDAGVRPIAVKLRRGGIFAERLPSVFFVLGYR